MPEGLDYRLVVFGAGGVGKSSLVLRFVKGTFRDAYIPTIEDRYSQVISCNKNVCTLQITDTTGSHQFPAMQRLNISKGHAFMLVFAVTSRASLAELVPIYDQIRALKPSEPIMLVANKSDEEAREVAEEEARALLQAQMPGCGFIETSAKTGANVCEAFQELLALDHSRGHLSLKMDLKKTRSQIRKEKLKGHCVMC